MSTSLTPGTHTIELDGVAQRYHVAGSGPVCLAHPGGPGFTWEYLRLPALEERLTMVYVEPLGTGGSGRLAAHPDGYSRARYAQALDGLIEHLGVPKVHLLGHSHGGFVTQYYALNHDDRLAGIVLYDSAPATGGEHFEEALRNLGTFTTKNAGNPKLQDVLDAWAMVPTIADDETFTSVSRRLFPAFFADYWSRESEFAPALASVNGSFVSGLDEHGAPDLIDDREALASLKTPALVVVGRHDFICGPRWAAELADLIPDSTQVVLERSGHFGHLEQPAEFTRAVADFVTSTADQAR
jgi:pimeloyl-ACP methyl ester carboxylesterase